jgi:hypothetical protein
MKLQLKLLWLSAGVFAGISTVSLALGSVRSGRDVSPLPQSVRELDIRKQEGLSFDRDLSHLSSLESRYQERLPQLSQHPRLKSPIKRVQSKSYRSAR